MVSAPDTAILVIDDDPTNLAIVSEYLGNEYSVLVAEDGETGIWRAEYARPDLILLDVMMPGIDGFETCRRLKALPGTGDIPVIFMTALAEVEHKVRGFQIGGVDYVAKPVQREELLARVAVHLRLRELTAHLQEANEALEKRVEERTRELRESERALRQAQKMEAVGTLAAGIAHDFNNILTAIVGFTDMALLKMAPDAPGREQLSRVMESTQRATQLVQQILTFSRLRDQERKAVHLVPIVEDASRLLRSSLPTTIEMIKEGSIPPERDVVFANPTQLHQVLINLCTNASHAMREEGGTLTIRLAEIAGDAPLPAELAPSRPEGYLKLSVRDTGHGMAPEIMEKIFDPYFTTKAAGEGTGLGLAMVRGIVESHGGVITVASMPQEGTLFEIYLPAVKAEVQDDREVPRELRGGAGHILLVDDEEMLTMLGEEMLQALGYRVTATNDSRAALETFRQHPGAFDLIITDLTMPGLTGRALAREATALRPDIPILLCTGFNESLESARESGIKECLLKPYSMDTLAHAVTRVLERE